MEDGDRIDEINAELEELEQLMEDTDAASLKEKAARWEKLVLESAELEGFSKAEARKILAEINREAEREIKAEVKAAVAAENATMTVREIDAANFEYAKMAMCENPNAKTIFDLQCATWLHVKQLIRHDADTKATFNILRKEGAKRKYSDPKHFASTELLEALYYSTVERLMRGEPDRWPAVLESLRNGLSTDEIFADLLFDEDFQEKFEMSPHSPDSVLNFGAAFAIQI